MNSVHVQIEIKALVINPLPSLSPKTIEQQRDWRKEGIKELEYQLSICKAKCDVEYVLAQVVDVAVIHESGQSNLGWPLRYKIVG